MCVSSATSATTVEASSNLEHDNYSGDRVVGCENSVDEVMDDIVTEISDDEFSIGDSSIDSLEDDIDDDDDNIDENENTVDGEYEDEGNSDKRDNVNISSAALALKKAMKENSNVFILLLHPKHKLFEVILVSDLKKETTMGDLLNMIIDKAKEKSLGSQNYIGFCKLRDRTELLDLSILVSGALNDDDSNSKRNNKNHADINGGDMLVAIPNGYNGKDMLKLSFGILENCQVKAALQNFDASFEENNNANNSKSDSKKSKISYYDEARSSNNKTIRILESLSTTASEFMMKLPVSLQRYLPKICIGLLVFSILFTLVIYFQNSTISTDFFNHWATKKNNTDKKPSHLDKPLGIVGTKIVIESLFLLVNFQTLAVLITSD